MNAEVNSLDLSSLTAVVTAYSYILAAFVFGSRAKGKARFNSDIDIAVLSDTELTYTQRRELIESISKLAPYPVDLIDLNREQGFVAREILTKGKLFFCRHPAALSERMRRLVYDSEDFLPYLREGNKRALEQCLKISLAPS